MCFSQSYQLLPLFLSNKVEANPTTFEEGDSNQRQPLKIEYFHKSQNMCTISIFLFSQII